MTRMARDAGGRRLYTAEFKRQQLERVERGERPPRSGAALGSAAAALGKLSSRQERFVDELLADPRRNAHAAAIRADFSNARALITASKLRQLPRVAYAIESREAELSARAKITREQLADILFDEIA